MDRAGESSVRELRAAGLRYTCDGAPGWTRVRRGRGFSFHDADGGLINGAGRQRALDLVIPPAWTDVWINPDPKGHLQATGYDDRGRKQYIYHPLWRELRDTAKYAGLADFAARLPGLRRRLARDLASGGSSPDHRTVTAAIVSLLDRTLIRIGNVRYATQNGSFGLTTLQDGHVEIDGPELRFNFRGKSGREHEIALRNRRLARIVRHCQELPGQELFQFEDADGELRTVSSEDVNAYLREHLGDGHSAKDFRTWAGTVLVAEKLNDFGEHGSETQAKRNVTAAIRSAADRLGNTLAVCRKGYVHPAITDAYLAGRFVADYGKALELARSRRPDGLRIGEAATLRFLTEQC